MTVGEITPAQFARALQLRLADWSRRQAVANSLRVQAARAQAESLGAAQAVEQWVENTRRKHPGLPKLRVDWARDQDGGLVVRVVDEDTLPADPPTAATDEAKVRRGQ